MESWFKNLLSAAVLLAGILAVYMVFTHQQIRWQRARGLLPRQSHGLYWNLRGFLETRKRLTVLVLVLSVTVYGYAAHVLNKPGPDSSEVSAEIHGGSTPEPKDHGSRAEEFAGLREWVLRLEDQRREFPQDYCLRIERGISIYESKEAPTIVIKSKLRYLKKEHEKHCSPQ